VNARRLPWLALAFVLWLMSGCARAPGGRTAIQERYDALAAAVRVGDVGRVHALWTADPAAAGSPLATLEDARISRGRVTEWTTTVQRWRMVGDTAVVDAGVRSAVTHEQSSTVTSQVVRGFWVHDANGWRIVRTEPLGAADVESAAR